MKHLLTHLSLTPCHFLSRNSNCPTFLYPDTLSPCSYRNVTHRPAHYLVALSPDPASAFCNIWTREPYSRRYKNNSTFCQHSVFMYFVWTSEQTAIISLYSTDWLVFITETECVYCAVRTGSSYTGEVSINVQSH